MRTEETGENHAQGKKKRRKKDWKLKTRMGGPSPEQGPTRAGRGVPVDLSRRLEQLEWSLPRGGGGRPHRFSAGAGRVCCDVVVGFRAPQCI